MNILFFHSSMNAGGIERTISLLSELYVKNGDNVTIVTMDDKESFYRLPDNVQHFKLGLMGDSTNKFQAIINNFKRIKGLRRIINKEERIDVLMSFGSNTALLCYIAKIGIKCKLVGAERSNPYLSDGRFWNRNKRMIAKMCDGFIFQTKGASNYYPASVQKKGIVLPNGLKAEDLKPLKLNLHKRVNVCAVGRMVDSKRYDDLLNAFSIVNKKHPGIVLNLFGDGPLKEELQNLTVELNIKDSVVFHGQCKTIMEEYPKYRIFAMSSEKEGFPNVLLEALASGCACVSTDCDFGPSELICDGENGFLVPVHDVDALADRICRLLEDDGLCRRFSESAISIRETHDINKIGLSLRAYFEQL